MKTAQAMATEFIEKDSAEQGTGCREHPRGFGELYNDMGVSLTHPEAAAAFLKNASIEVPNAGAGSYRKVAECLGMKEIKVIDWTSSAGDWCFGVRNDDGWRLMFQENRYPHHGFRYSLGEFFFGTFEELCQFNMN